MKRLLKRLLISKLDIFECEIYLREVDNVEIFDGTVKSPAGKIYWLEGEIVLDTDKYLVLNDWVSHEIDDWDLRDNTLYELDKVN